MSYKPHKHDVLRRRHKSIIPYLGIKPREGRIYGEAGFAAMKKDLEKLHIRASEIKSITVGINVNDRLEATGLGLISVNDKPFKKSGILSGFSDAIASGDRLKKAMTGAVTCIIIRQKNPDTTVLSRL